MKSKSCFLTACPWKVLVYSKYIITNQPTLLFLVDPRTQGNDHKKFIIV